MLGPRKRPTSAHSREASEPSAGRPTAVYRRHAQRAGASGGTPNSSDAMRPAGAQHARELAHRCRRVVHVAQQVGEGDHVEAGVRERERLGLALDQLHARAIQAGEARAGGREHRGALVDPDDRALAAREHLGRDHSGARGHVQHAIAVSRCRSGHERAPPAWVLPEAERGRQRVIA